jgi:lipoprotein-anchoring transpeptidase ErfK/SrfK
MAGVRSADRPEYGRSRYGEVSDVKHSGKLTAVAGFRQNRNMRRLGTILLVMTVLAPAGATIAAASITPRSASALPDIEISTGSKPVRIAAADLGARRTDKGLVIDHARFENGLAELGKIFNEPAVPATYELVNNHVRLKAGAPGFELDPVATKALLLRALRGSRSNLKLKTREVPAPGPPQFAIVVRLEDYMLDLYQGIGLERNYTVGVGALRFETPPGAYHIKSKAKNPSWNNPGSRWARYMPAHIRPGPRNPLGTRALRLDRGALVIHGTPQPWTIGRRASHGCIRMKRDDVEQLFDIVPTGTPVFIVP